MQVLNKDPKEFTEDTFEEKVRSTVSVIVPFYGSGVEELHRCVQALLQQSYPADKFEIIVVDNNPIAILSSLSFLQNRRITVVHQTVPGSYSARNLGISISTGTILAFTDADCIPDREWLTLGISSLINTPDCGLIAGAISPVYESTSQPNLFELYDSTIFLRQETYVNEYHFGATANVITYASTFKRVGLFDSSYFSGGDRNWGIRVWQSGLQLKYEPEAIVKHQARNTPDKLYCKARRLVGQGYVYATTKHRHLFLRVLRIEFSLFKGWLRLILKKRTSIRLSVLCGILVLLAKIQLIRFNEAVRLCLHGNPQR